MKSLIIICGIFFFQFSGTAQGTPSAKRLYNDSTLHERFVVHLLNEYDLPGRWIYLRLDSCNNTESYQTVPLSSLYKSLAAHYTSFTRKNFIFFAADGILLFNSFDNCRHEAHPIKGAKVNMQQYNRLLKMPKEKFLSTYFDKDKKLRKQYTKWLYEIIAVCYANNVKVITLSCGSAYYEVFK